MPRYKVSYETDKEPEGLPEGATVEKVSSLPLRLTTCMTGRSVWVDKSGDGVWVTISSNDPESGVRTCAFLHPDEVRQIADALLEAIEAGTEETDQEYVKVGRSVDYETRVRVTRTHNGVEAGMIGLIYGDDVDEDGDYFVEFDGFGAYVHHTDLVLAE